MEEVNYQEQVPEENNLKIRDLEEKQRILKDRVLLIGQNLIDSKEKTILRSAVRIKTQTI